MPAKHLLPGLALAVLLPGLAMAQSRPRDLWPTPLAYATVRANLMTRGYRPLRFPAAEIRMRCFTRAEICNAYPETESCAGTGQGECLFVYAGPRGGYFTVTTRGEALQDLVVIRSGPASAREARAYRGVPPI